MARGESDSKALLPSGLKFRADIQWDGRLTAQPDDRGVGCGHRGAIFERQPAPWCLLRMAVFGALDVAGDEPDAALPGFWERC